MPTVADIGSLIVRSVHVRGGRPRVAGTEITVRRIVGWYKQGLTPGRDHQRDAPPVIGPGLCRPDILPRQSWRNRSGHRRGRRRGDAPGNAACSSSERPVTIRLYFDEDSMWHALVTALRARGI